MEFVKIGVLNERPGWAIAKIENPNEQTTEYAVVSGDIEAFRKVQFLDVGLQTSGPFALRGRFPGTQQGLEDSAKFFEAASKRGPGRPRGSKSKKTAKKTSVEEAT